MIDIVLATYNGERYLAEQIESIQDNRDYLKLISRFIIVDDGSVDKTPEIVKQFLEKDNKIEWHFNSSGKTGPANNFSFGLSLTTAEYVMLSDQDDIWLPNKISSSVFELLALEEKFPEQPILVFSDKLIVNERLNTLCSSYFHLKKIPIDWHLSFGNICQQNVGSGCTMIFNRALLIKATPIPDNAYMHDWWLILVASRCGKVKLIETPLIKYRQHSNNTIGANQTSFIKKIREINLHLARFEHSLLKTIYQAQAFKIFESQHSLPHDDTVHILANILTQSKFERIKLILSKSITRSHFLGKVALLMALLKMKVKPNIKQ